MSRSRHPDDVHRVAPLAEPSSSSLSTGGSSAAVMMERSSSSSAALVELGPQAVGHPRPSRPLRPLPLRLLQLLLQPRHLRPRERSRACVAALAKRLVHLFCVVPCQPLIHDALIFRYFDYDLLNYLARSPASSAPPARAPRPTPPSPGVGGSPPCRRNHGEAHKDRGRRRRLAAASDDVPDDDDGGLRRPTVRLAGQGLSQRGQAARVRRQ
uniref:Uncharacterized protein n=1 Tax=Ananas comosus var. bracteatus TaxID=296719 RepID=A0A6V7NIH7_ANACO|nr:unnamed protein product [Ananas comosus var. bracteatus]